MAARRFGAVPEVAAHRDHADRWKRTAALYWIAGMFVLTSSLTFTLTPSLTFTLILDVKA